jgi:alkylhydroperoxidase family enzyme
LAPAAFAAFDVLLATANAVEPRLAGSARTSVGRALGLRDGAVSRQPWSDFAEQFVVDVAAMTDEQRAEALPALGADAFTFVQLLYVYDVTTRVRSAFAQHFDGDAFDAEPAEPAPSLWDACQAMFAAVARLDALDPVTTELVRLRGARSHNCRLCRSLRSVRAEAMGADESLYDQIDNYEKSRFSERHKVALRLTDALIWQPLGHPPGLGAQLGANLTPAEQLEIVLDVARNAANKIAVALRADDPHVANGLERFDTDADGQLVYGL